MAKGFLHITIIIAVACSFASCRSTKFVSEGEYLLDKMQIVSDNPNEPASGLRPYLRQQANFKLFGLIKWQLYVYNWSGKSEKNWLNKQLRRIGEAPVIMDSLLVEQSAVELSRFLITKGYLHAEVRTVVDTSQAQKARVTYHITSGEPFRIGAYRMALNNPDIDSIARFNPPRPSALAAAFRSLPEGYTPLVKEGDLFDRNKLELERQRITALLRRRGYYAFQKDYLVYQADTSGTGNTVDVEMQLLPARKVDKDGNVTDTLHGRYYLNDVTASVATLRPSVWRKAIYLTPGRAFSERSVEQTYSAFSTLRALKNVTIRFSEFERNDSLMLNGSILSIPAETQSVGVEVEGTNSAGDMGFASGLSYQHRNLFRGSEVFTARLRGAYEALSGNKGTGLDNYWEFGGETSLLFPQFLFPFLKYGFRRSVRASTELQVNYNNQSRPEYDRSLVSAAWNYIWQERNNTVARHTFKLIDIDYVFLPRINNAFRDSLPKSMQLYNYSDQFIMSTGYAYSFNNFSYQSPWRNTHSLRVSFELAGNLLHAVSSLTGAKKSGDGMYELFNIPYAQFVKSDVDFSKGIVLDNRNRLAFHAGAGFALPYGNARMMPFERRYFAGGANSVRGWAVRALGPGSMPIDKIPGNTKFALQVGDMRLDLNMEYRTKLFWRFELAAYVDAGNIWTIRPYADQPNGNFDLKRFYKEIAASYGLGLRMDFEYFLVRLDTGFKAYDPQAQGSRQWAILRPNFGDNFALHFAIGYPF